MDLFSSFFQQEKDPPNSLVDAELVKLLYEQALPAMIGALLVASGVALALLQIEDQDKVLNWYGAFGIIYLIRYFLIKLYFIRQKSSSYSYNKYWFYQFLFITWLSGIIWSFLSFYLLPSENGVYQTLIASALAGVSGGSVPYFSGSRAATFIYAPLLLVPFSIMMFLHYDVPHHLLSLFSLLYLVLLLISSIKTYQVVHKSVKLKFENNELLSTLTVVNRQMEDVNLGLSLLISDMNPRIEYLANYDLLTDLPNRHFFNTYFKHAIDKAFRHSHQVALLFFDLDDFKKVNDSLSHAIGDYLLIKIVERIKKTVDQPSMLARIGGDEFIIVIENTAIEYVEVLAKKICELFFAPFHINDIDIYITASVGISMYPRDGEDVQTLFKNADMAVDQAKGSGKNTYVFYEANFCQYVKRKQDIAINLRAALKKDELMLFYQPIVQLSDDRVIGFEALLRWRSPILGAVQPSDFIPIAEESDLIIALGQWILQTACSQIFAWEKAGLMHEKRIAINLSARQFKEANLMQEVVAVLKKEHVSAKYLTIELTETCVMQDIECNSLILKEISELGVAVAIDDFGTGYSSLNYLRKLPINFLKIDRSFITNVNSNDADAAIVAAIISLAHNLNLKVTAEGVETVDHYQFLKKNHCDHMQGYFVSKPLSPSEIPKFLSSR